MNLAHLAVSTPMDHVMAGTEAVPYWCIGCGQAVLRELLPDGSRVTWHRMPLNPLCLVGDDDMDNPQ